MKLKYWFSRVFVHPPTGALGNDNCNSCAHRTLAQNKHPMNISINFDYNLVVVAPQVSLSWSVADSHEVLKQCNAFVNLQEIKLVACQHQASYMYSSCRGCRIHYCMHFIITCCRQNDIGGF